MRYDTRHPNTRLHHASIILPHSSNVPSLPKNKFTFDKLHYLSLMIGHCSKKNHFQWLWVLEFNKVGHSCETAVMMPHQQMSEFISQSWLKNGWLSQVDLCTGL